MPVDGDDAVLGAQALNDGHRSRLDDEEVAALIAGGEEHLARLDRANATELAQPGSLALVEAGKRAVAIDGLGDALLRLAGFGRSMGRLPEPRGHDLRELAPGSLEPLSVHEEGRRAL